LIVKFIGVEVAAAVPPPYIPLGGVPGFVTVTGTVPEFMIAEAGIVVVSLVALTRVVAWGPLMFMTAPDAKFVPSTSKGKLAPPAVVLLGVSWAIAGVVPGCGGMVDLE
jgi:hypothetical protein